MGELDYKKYKILLVDDELDNLANLIFAFELEFNLATASSAAEALDILNRENIAVVISDQRMPGVSGTELLGIIKESHPKVVRILITAYADIQAAIEAINQGHVYRYIPKDLPMSEIETIIKQAIEHYQMKEDLEAATQCLIKSEKLVTIGEMAAGIGHEINNTVCGIQFGIDSLIEHLRTKDFTDPNIDDLLRKTKEYVKRLTSIVGRLRDFGKPGYVEEVDIPKIVDTSIEMAKDGFKRLLTKIEIIKEMDGGIPKIEGNYVYFEEIFLNLIQNACQAMQGMRGKIIVKGRSDHNCVYIAVQDTGPGICEEDSKKVFGAFYTTKRDGMGMGLYIIDNIIRTFGGRLELESELGRGSTFTVVLPIVGSNGFGK
jgi:signal transduction histidine kinase